MSVLGPFADTLPRIAMAGVLILVALGVLLFLAGLIDERRHR